jgi:site-specific recombinase XerD
VKLLLDELDSALVAEFLEYLEKERKNSTRTRNARLAAIHSFFRFVASQEPEYLLQAQRVLAIPQKRCFRTTVSFLNQTEIEALLAIPEKGTWLGRRDFTMLLLMVQTGIRVSEVIGLRVQDVVFGTAAHLQCRGKGRKERCTPLTRQTFSALHNWIKTEGLTAENLLFTNRRGTILSRDAVERRVAAYAAKAEKNCPSLKEKNVTPHVLRHTTAVHLLRAGVDTAIIALWLGHESLETTQIYLHADLSIKERALAQTTPVGVKLVRYIPPDPLLRFLESL